jgi:hypothetical protein
LKYDAFKDVAGQVGGHADSGFCYHDALLKFSRFII